MRLLTSLLDVLGLALLAMAGWLLAGGWLAASVAGVSLLLVSRSLSGAPPVRLRVLAGRRRGREAA